MSHHGNDEEHRDGPGGADGAQPSRPQEILEDRAGEPAVSDEEAVLAYNANAERPDTGGAEGAGGSGGPGGTDGRAPERAE